MRFSSVMNVLMILFDKFVLDDPSHQSKVYENRLK